MPWMSDGLHQGLQGCASDVAILIGDGWRRGCFSASLLALGIHPSWRLQDDRRFVSGLSTVFSAEAMADCCQFSQILIRRSD